MGRKAFLEEANSGKGLKVARWMKIIFGIIPPAVILFVFVYGPVTFGREFRP